MRQLLTLNKDGKLALRSGNGNETIFEHRRSHVLLLLDLSGSMAGAKLQQAKSGAVDFARSANEKRYSTGLAVFADRAAMVCDPVPDSTVLARKVEKLNIGMVGGSTNLAAGLVLAAKLTDLAAVVVVTDGATNDSDAALDAANPLKARGIDIICIGTDDADADFLRRLATRVDLSMHISAENLRTSIRDASRLLLKS